MDLSQVFIKLINLNATTFRSGKAVHNHLFSIAGSLIIFLDLPMKPTLGPPQICVINQIFVSKV